MTAYITKKTYERIWKEYIEAETEKDNLGELLDCLHHNNYKGPLLDKFERQFDEAEHRFGRACTMLRDFEEHHFN